MYTHLSLSSMRDELYFRPNWPEVIVVDVANSTLLDEVWA